MTEAGLEDPLIIASGDLDEDLIADMKRQGARINAWGVGTRLITAYDEPALNGVYKLSAVKNSEAGPWEPRMKVSSNIEKATDPGCKQVVRYFDKDGAPLGDVMGLWDEAPETGEVVHGRLRKRPHASTRLSGVASARPMLEPVFAEGRRVAPPESTRAVRERAQDQVARLPEEFKRLRNPEIYRVLLSERIGSLKDDVLTGQNGAVGVAE